MEYILVNKKYFTTFSNVSIFLNSDQKKKKLLKMLKINKVGFYWLIYFYEK